MDIRLKRIEYLRYANIDKKEGRWFTWMSHTSHKASKGWTNQSLQGSKVPYSKGKRLIIAHGGSDCGFIKNGLLMFESGKKTGDYHLDMNYDNFEK